MHIVLIRHASRIDKSDTAFQNHGGSPSDQVDLNSSRWLSTYDPPLNASLASDQMDIAFKKLSTHLTLSNVPSSTPNIIFHSSPYNRCIQTTELLLSHIMMSMNDPAKGPVTPPSSLKKLFKLRIDQALSEWLSENFNMNYLPPNDDGYSMISNINAYLNPQGSVEEEGPFTEQSRQQLSEIKDQVWMYNRLGHCGEYGESPKDFKKRCFDYLISLLQFYNQKQTFEQDKGKVIFIVSHGAVISTLLQILINKPIFNDIPLCTPIYLKQSDIKRSVFNLMDYDFNLSSILSMRNDKELYNLLGSDIDFSLMDYDSIFSEFEPSIQTSIQSQYMKNSSTKQSGRKRSNTYNAEIKKSRDEEEERSSLRQTRSSKQLHLMDKDTNEKKVIDLAKLESYFAGYSDSDEEESISDVENGQLSIQEIKDLNSKSNEQPLVTIQPPNNIFPHADKKSKKQEIFIEAKRALMQSSSAALSKIPATKGKISQFLFRSNKSEPSFEGEEEAESSDETNSDSSDGAPFLTFGRSSNSIVDGSSNADNAQSTTPNSAGGYIVGTFSKTPFGSGLSKQENLPLQNKNGLESKKSSFLDSLGILKSKSITLISTMSNETIKTRSSEPDDDEQNDRIQETPLINDSVSSYLPDFTLDRNKRRKSKLYNESSLLTHDNDDQRSSIGDTDSLHEKSRDILKNILFNNHSNNSFQSSDDEISWFGGNFQRQAV
ncbi:hypothetical protein CANARDRAFT_177897 [[Candida] arabinofermentans NRRL YB-2248]|uniref:Uncharacterized protein n=1 Tax=[Candida] arabinofermentans NRRL YB-2248 TaxID=983967 RepID=A0A1E4SUR2_9ASCO|nr:hypothetical protein CANARDRAFT_177897 [[Candida] arabinofermentans NRRL YB-2248]